MKRLVLAGGFCLGAIFLLLGRRVGVSLHHFPPLAAFNLAAPFPLEPAAVLVGVVLRRCRAVLPILALVALAASSPAKTAGMPLAGRVAAAR